MMCPLIFKTQQLQAENGGQLPESAPPWPSDVPKTATGCISKYRAEAQSQYRVALPTIRKPRAREALTTAQVAFLTALDGMPPGADERVISYEVRQRALRDKFNEAQARFEVEQ